MSSNHLVSTLLAAALMLGANTAAALDDDRRQPIHVKADSAERNDKQGITTYRGDVRISQGSLNIAAREVTMYGTDTISKIVATGRPAQLKQKPQPDKGVITAKGNTIEYSLASEVVKLKNNAYIEQDGTEVHGELITYDMGRQIVRATGAVESSKQVEMIIPPSQTATSDSDGASQPSN